MGPGNWRRSCLKSVSMEVLFGTFSKWIILCSTNLPSTIHPSQASPRNWNDYLQLQRQTAEWIQKCGESCGMHFNNLNHSKLFITCKVLCQLHLLPSWQHFGPSQHHFELSQQLFTAGQQTTCVKSQIVTPQWPSSSALLPWLCPGMRKFFGMV